NVMQLFSTRFSQDHAPTIQCLAELSAQEKVHAVQLELGVGLRWPGAERERFVDAFCQTLGNFTPLPSTNGVGFSLPQSVEKEHPAVHLHLAEESPLSLQAKPEPTRFGLHFHDPLSGVGILGGIEFGGEEPTHSGRLMLSLGGTEMALFTGEDASR